MRIAAVQVLLAAVSLAAVFTASTSSHSNDWSYQRNIREVNSDLLSQEDASILTMKYPPKYVSADGWLPPRESNRLIRREGGEEGRDVHCCPSVEEMIEPVGGTNQDNLFVQLYRDGNSTQKFYELACRTGIEGQPCRFMDHRYHNISRCVQMYSYTYAIVKEPEKDRTRHHHHRGLAPGSNFPTFSTSSPDGTWVLDYIKVRSGCSCVLESKRLEKPGRKKGKGNAGMKL